MATKLFYTPEELKSLSEAELLELTTFGDADNIYYYSDLEKVVKENGEYSFHFRDKSIVYTQQEDTFNEIKLGKARYDMLTKSLEQNDEQNQREEAFYKKIESMVATQIEYSKQAVDAERKKVTDLVNLVENNNKDVISNIESMFKRVEDKWNTKLDLINDFDVKSYNAKMKDLNKIIDSFGELLA